ncbi:hypothetical protein GGG16DRAFT_108914 [Schizophyllum commune]
MSDLSPSDDVLPELLHDPDDDGPVREALQDAIEDYYMCRGTLFKRKAPHEFASEAQLARIERHLSTVLACGREAANRLGKDSLAASLERVAETSPILRSLAPSSYRIVLEEFSTDAVVMKEASTHNIHPYNSTSTNMAHSLYALLAALSLERQGERVIDSWVASNLLPAMESVSSSLTIRDGLAQSVHSTACIELKPHMHLDPTSPASAPDSGSVLSLANQAPPASVDAASVNAPNPAIDAEAATVTASTDTATKTLPKRKAGHGSTTQIPRKKAKRASDVREETRTSDVFGDKTSSDAFNRKRTYEYHALEGRRAPGGVANKPVSDVRASDVPPVPLLKGKEDIPPMVGPSLDAMAPKHPAPFTSSTSTVRQQWR